MTKNRYRKLIIGHAAWRNTPRRVTGARPADPSGMGNGGRLAHTRAVTTPVGRRIKPCPASATPSSPASRPTPAESQPARVKGAREGNGERLSRQRGRLAPQMPALRPSHSRTRHHPTTQPATRENTKISSKAAGEALLKHLTQRGIDMERNPAHVAAAYAASVKAVLCVPDTCSGQPLHAVSRQVRRR
jgi:hypothetical protein